MNYYRERAHAAAWVIFALLFGAFCVAGMVAAALLAIVGGSL